MSRLKMHGIYKSFGGVRALKDVNLSLEKAEVLGLIGENGAGKSTLMKILAGAIRKDEGRILVDNKEINIQTPADSLVNGISVIYQELNMAPDLTVAENIFLGNYPMKGIAVDWQYMFKKASELMESLGVSIEPKAIVKDLSIAQQQMVEISRAIKNESNILIFDEPSAVLGKKDSEILFELIKKLKNKGVSIVYISHRLDEVLRITDKINVLRDGRNIVEKETKSMSMQDLIGYMTGRSYRDMWPEIAKPAKDSKIVLEIKNLSSTNKFNNISFNIREGEVLGLAGLVGSGRSEIARSIFGIDPIDSGEIFIENHKVNIKNPMIAIKNSIGFVMEDRKTLGLLLDRPIFENITLANINKYSFKGWISSKKEFSSVNKLKKILSIKTANIRNDSKSLSGGNQQKVVIAKWLDINPKILILDEPTRGVDVGAKAEIYRIIEDLKSQGKAILLISSEFSEILGLSNRIAFIRRGELTGIFTRDDVAQNPNILEALSEEKVVQYA